MEQSEKTATQPTRTRDAGPQGTQLFSAEELRDTRSVADDSGEGRASVQQPALEGLSADLKGIRFSLRPGRQTLGRRGDNDIVIDDLSVSAAHAWIMNQQGHYVIMNTLSTNGTFVNDRRVHEATLKHGDRIRLGQAEFVFLTREPGSRRGRMLRWVTAGVAVAAAAAALLAWWLL